ncbi:AfsR/SARP family transcriptional regulator [Nonomuraea jiangxiensis]|uniref:DNA-binding transcriptional activator of the SARP family n=1 Tax=Nonomuraea jiangxiensis TaxID=633440 RepID=A0A1G8M6X0_9ACTN|nr:AfsR/SARP family transcriptional regulator [Nonomuraea jiangxiensis]SDI63696.1 DNA-binding transcriptional activator of the SARP family [Nonomuraea jiangxiensis]
MSTGLRFSLLGPVRAWRGETELDLGAPQQRAVLSFLLLRDGEAASVEEIVDALWAERAPGSALSIVRTYICRLRRSVSSAEDDDRVIRSSGGGYAITAEPKHVDWTAFREMVREAQALRLRGNLAEAADLLRNSLSLWKGAPLGGARGDYVDQERARLVQRRVATLEEQVALDLELGRHAEVIDDLTAFIAAEPMRERLRELQMTALYRSGRQAEALAVYDEVRRLLAAELGIDPCAELQDLYVRILRADPDLAGPAPRPAPAPTVERPPAQVPAVPPGFVGRGAELADIQNTLRPSGWTPVVAIIGLGGVGKTALAVKAAHSMRDRFPDGQVYADLGASTGRSVSPATVLASFLRAFGVPEERLPVRLEERAALWRTVLADRRVLILLDDAIDADQVHHLLPAAPGCAAIVTTWRHMMDLSGVRWIRLEALPPGDALEMLARLAGRRRVLGERTTAVELVELCSHQPLGVRVAADLLQVRPHWTVRQVRLRLEDELYRPAGTNEDCALIEAPLLRAQSRLDAHQATAFRLAALPDQGELTPEAVAALLDLPRPQAHRLLESLVDAHLLLAGPRGTYRYQRLVKAFARRQAWAHEGVERCDAALHRFLSQRPKAATA